MRWNLEIPFFHHRPAPKSSNFQWEWNGQTSAESHRSKKHRILSPKPSNPSESRKRPRSDVTTLGSKPCQTFSIGVSGEKFPCWNHCVTIGWIQRLPFQPPVFVKTNEKLRFFERGFGIALENLPEVYKSNTTSGWKSLEGADQGITSGRCNRFRNPNELEFAPTKRVKL